MTSYGSSALTPVKVRGKRHGTRLVKPRAGKCRDPALQKRRAADTDDDPAESSVSFPGRPSTPRKRRRVNVVMSPLERLPPEILQLIFEQSFNVNLPLTSRHLIEKLSQSQHLQTQMTSDLLSPVMGSANDAATTQDLARATRLLNSRFVTWDFFQAWLRGYVETEKASDPALGVSQSWSALQPASRLLPPRKLLSGPFTTDRLAFLAVLGQNISDIGALDAVSNEIAHGGLQTAIQEGSVQAVSMLLAIGVKPNTEMLRAAVMDTGCQEPIVRLLLEGDAPHTSLAARASAVGSSCALDAVDVLDPMLWSWANKARSAGDAKGQWLMELLKDTQRRKEHDGRVSEVAP